MDSSMLLTFAVCLFVIQFFKWIFFTKRQPPGPWGLPVVGYIPFLSRKIYVSLQELGKKYGNIYSIRLGSQYVVVLHDFQSTKDAFAQDAFIGRPPESPFEFTKESEETEAFTGLPWKEQRRFSLHMLRDLGFGKSRMEEHIQEEIVELLEHFQQHVGEPFSCRELLTSSTSNNISSLMFGKRLPYNDPVRKMLTKSVNEIGGTGGTAIWQLFFPWLRYIFQFLKLGTDAKLSEITKDFSGYIVKEIEEHKASLNPNNIRDFLDGYLNEITKRTDDPSFCQGVLQDLTGAFFGAGSETVRVTVEWLLLMVATHQDSQRRIQAEIDDVTGKNRPPVGPDLKVMPYTEAFIMELMRWRSIIPINLMRYTIVDTELEGFFIPKHTSVLANIWAIHHDSKYWGKDADDFRPERFLSEDGKTVKKSDHFIPFSIGKRSCPGEPLARVEIFLYFSSILQKFNIQLPDGKVPDFEGVLGLSLQPKPQELIFTTRI